MKWKLNNTLLTNRLKKNSQEKLENRVEWKQKHTETYGTQ